MIKMIIVLATLFLTVNSYGQGILSPEGDTLATIDPVGAVFDGMKQQVGEILSSGEVKNRQGEIIGNIVGTKFNNAQGVLLGELKVVGGITQIVMPGDFVFATIVSGNQLVDITGNILVKSSGNITQLQLVAYFFYF